MIAFVGCKKEPEKGGLTIKVLLNGSVLQGAFVGIATSQENLDDSYYLSYELSEANGEANFTELAPDDYFYESYYQIGSAQYIKEGQIMIVEGKHVDLTVTLN